MPLPLARSSLLLACAAALASCAPATMTGAAASAPVVDAPVRRTTMTWACGTIAPGTLVDLAAEDRTLRTEIRYATANNFTGAALPGYDRPRALLRPAAAQALLRAHRSLAADGLGLKVFDGFRPVSATLAMVDWAERTDNEWVLEQGYVARQSGHNRGATVDLTVVRLDTGRELEMGTAFDTFSEAAHTANATGEVRENRLRLQRAMEAQGFANYDKEWWHYRLPGENEPLDAPLSCFR